jgi:hypothetical protein
MAASSCANSSALPGPGEVSSLNFIMSAPEITPNLGGKRPILRRVRFAFCVRRAVVILLSMLCVLAPLAASATVGAIAPGDSVRLTRGEMLLFMGKNLVGAPKGQEFVVLKPDFAQGVVYVAFVKEDGTLIAATLPTDALEAAPPNGWTDLFQGLQAFREQRYEDTRRLLVRASQDAQYRSIAAPIAGRVNGALGAWMAARSSDPGRAAAAKPAFLTAVQGLRETAEQLNKLGYFCLALPMDEGVDRLGAQILGNPPAAPAQGANPAAAGGMPPSKLDREDLAKRVAVSDRAAARAHQAVPLHRLNEASKCIEEGLAVEPGRPDLKMLKASIKKDMDEADEHYQQANTMRRIPGGTVHALTGIEMGLKICVDHPGLRELKKDLKGAFEERTSPPVTAAFLAAAKVPTSQEALTEGHKLYTTRCTECHDLDMVESRSNSGWQKIVGTMSRRAHLNDDQQARILEYLAAAANTMDSVKP